jgi:threo-3-hydroxy-L-aspartate ammonia-lyase
VKQLAGAADDRLIGLAEIRAAAERLARIALRTPLLAIGDGAWLKPESLQPTGSFKIRGAYNTLAQLTPAQRRRGVVAHSSGNHGQAVARAARLLGMRAVVVMPDNAPRVKVAGVEADGAEVVFVGPHNEERVQRAKQIAGSEELSLVSSANDDRVIAGQATCGLEIAEQLAELGVEGPLAVLVPIGLGGLASGIGTALKLLRQGSVVLGVEPELAADTKESLERGQRITWPAERTARTVADGLRAESPAERPFAYLRRYIDGVLTVSEDEIAAAVASAATSVRLVLEPSGAVALAAHLFRRDAIAARQVVIVASGGNVDRQRYLELLSAG